MKYDVFISYSRADYIDLDSHKELPGNIISKLMDAFDRAGITYWIDKEGIHSGDAWAKLIGKAISDSAVFLFVSSVNSNRSDCWSADEIALARNKKKHIIPFLLDDTPFNDEFALFIARLDYVDYASIGETAIPKLLESIEVILDEKDPNRKTIRDLKKQQSVLRDEIKRKESERKHVISQLKELGADVNDEPTLDAEEVKQLKRELAAKDEELSGLRQQNANLQAEKESLVAQSRELQVSLDETKERLGKLSDEIKSKSLEIEQLEKTCEGKDGQISELKTEIARLSEFERREKERRAEAERQEAERKCKEEKIIKEKKALQKNVFEVNSVTFEMVAVQGGTFTMGATSEQGSDAWDKEKPTHSVTLSDYMIGKYEVTQELWQAVMCNNPSHFNGSNLPVEKVSWNEVQEFIRRLNQLTGQNFRLPTEAEWEHAARGGNKSRGYKYSGSNNIGDVAWYTGNSGDKTHPVGTKSPNELGIYDMSGNVWEWCEDWYGDYSSGSQTNPKGPSSGSGRVLRGGGWGSSAQICRVANRSYDSPGRRGRNLGFRVALVP